MKSLSLLLFLSLITTVATAQKESVRKKHFNIKKGVAIKGYDPVSYFSGNPLKGTKDHQHTYEGVTYYFSNDSNLKKFKSDPKKFEPQYGGWCAYAIGETGDKVKIDPKTYQIWNDRLYLFYNFGGLNTLKSWEAEEESLRNKADKNWSKTVQ